ncbi:MAG: SufS family cysteine desulfurase [Candidatus Micrarchaeota archaeon]
MNFEKLRPDFPVLSRKINGKPVVYLDNAATSLKPKPVIDAVNRYYSQETANVHRGLHKLSQEASEEYEKSHTIVEKFVNAKAGEIVFTRGTTDSLNAIMYTILNNGLVQSGDEILLTRAEHHANLVPWQFLAKKTGAKLKFAELNPDFSLNMADFEQKMSKKTKIVSVPHVSNTVAAINDVSKIGKIAKDKNPNCIFIVDAAQSVPHIPIDLKKINCDFLAFSGHKMLGPTGIGVLYGKKELLEKLEPFEYGGAMIHSVSYEKSLWNKLPDKWEAGTPHIAGAYGMKAAVEYLSKIGMDNVHEHEKQLTKFALEKLSDLENRKKIRIYNPKNAEKQGGVILFDSPALESHEIGIALDEMQNIAVRTGMMCAQPIVEKLNKQGLARASFYIYNTKEEVEIFADTISEIIGSFQ